MGVTYLLFIKLGGIYMIVITKIMAAMINLCVYGTFGLIMTAGFISLGFLVDVIARYNGINFFHQKNVRVRINGKTYLTK